MKFYVLEPHVDGTTQYDPAGVQGPAEREADEHEVKHLVDLKVLSTDKPKPPEKAEGAAPLNKADPKPSNKAA